ncbi:MAG: ParB/RepB/Spo0J family partition protein [Mucinivorans sp.]
MNKPIKGLGKGLDAIFTTSGVNPTAPRAKDNSISSIELSQIEANESQPRTNFDEQSLEELARSIARLGVIQPITIRKKGENRYQIVSGERRFRASKMAGLTQIPAYVRTVGDEQLLEMSLVENIQRENLGAIEIALTYQRLMNECNLTQEQLADNVGKNRATVANYIRLLRLPAEVQAALVQELITMGHARALLALLSENDQLVLLDRIVRGALSVRATEQIIVDMGAPKAPRKSLPGSFKALGHELSNSLGTKVNLSQGENGAGKIVIRFSDAQQLERLKEILTK